VQFLQLYVEKDRDASKETVEKADKLGFSGLFLTVRISYSITLICHFNGTLVSL
jgi:isopentenyl diphosphate isomerase/L-lactate dehydrogenase-like FMN-dependent dehydrogenase